MRKAHALHNEELCELLISTGKYNDWVVTTAFYSAVNYVKHQMFPLEHDKITYDEFSDYYSFISQKNNTSPHKALINLVRNDLHYCKNAYKWLHDQCHNARYNNYVVSDPIAAEARKKLEVVKSSCKK